MLNILLKSSHSVRDFQSFTIYQKTSIFCVCAQARVLHLESMFMSFYGDWFPLRLHVILSRGTMYFLPLRALGTWMQGVVGRLRSISHWHSRLHSWGSYPASQERRYRVLIAREKTKFRRLLLSACHFLTPVSQAIISQGPSARVPWWRWRLPLQRAHDSNLASSLHPLDLSDYFNWCSNKEPQRQTIMTEFLVPALPEAYHP